MTQPRRFEAVKVSNTATLKPNQHRSNSAALSDPDFTSKVYASRLGVPQSLSLAPCLWVRTVT